MANAVAYGFHAVQDRFADPVTAVGEDTINQLITQSMEEHNRQLNLARALFLREGITEPTRTFKTPVAVRNQPLDEIGRPLPVKGEAQYTVGFPMQDSGQAIGYTWLESRKRTVEDLNNLILTIQDGDRSWVFDHILAGIFNNTERTFFEPERGDVTVKPLANGDGQVYMVPNGAFAGGTDNHFFAQANAIDDGADNPFPAIFRELTEHPENGGTGAGRIITFVPPGLSDSIKALASFYMPPNMDLTPGSGNTVLTGSLGVTVPGTVLGMELSGTWIVEWPRLPANYMVHLATGGEPPLGERVDPDAGLRGFFEPDNNADFPWYQRNWMRRVGYGAWNRVAAAVTRIGSGSYAVPTGYANVMY